MNKEWIDSISLVSDSKVSLLETLLTAIIYHRDDDDTIQHTKLIWMAKKLYTALWTVQNAFVWSLNDPSWSGNIVKSWKTRSSTTIWNTTKQTLENGSKPIFDT